MIVDASALIAVVFKEPDAHAMIDALAAASNPRAPAPALVEAGIVSTKLGAPGRARLKTLLDRAGISIVAFDADHAELAATAWQIYGRGSGHRARLNFGDCMVYAVASLTDEPLLFKGDDFGHTDLRSALS